MTNAPLALAVIPPDALNDDEYRALCDALSESQRGRAFLAEYARRNRNADTAVLLDAIGRIEAQLAADASAAERLRDDLRMLLIAIRLARPEIDAAGPATQAAKLTKLLDLLERRIDAMAETKAVDDAQQADAAAEPTRSQLAVVLAPDEPELPIPSAASFEPRLVENAAAEPAAQLPRPDPLAAIIALSADERLALFT